MKNPLIIGAGMVGATVANKYARMPDTGRITATVLNLEQELPATIARIEGRKVVDEKYRQDLDGRLQDSKLGDLPSKTISYHIDDLSVEVAEFDMLGSSPFEAGSAYSAITDLLNNLKQQGRAPDEITSCVNLSTILGARAAGNKNAASDFSELGTLFEVYTAFQDYAYRSEPTSVVTAGTTSVGGIDVTSFAGGGITHGKEVQGVSYIPPASIAGKFTYASVMRSLLQSIADAKGNPNLNIGLVVPACAIIDDLSVDRVPVFGALKSIYAAAGIDANTLQKYAAEIKLGGKIIQEGGSTSLGELRFDNLASPGEDNPHTRGPGGDLGCLLQVMGFVGAEDVADAVIATHRGDNTYNIAQGGKNLQETCDGATAAVETIRLKYPTTAPIGPADVPMRMIALNYAGKTGLTLDVLENLDALLGIYELEAGDNEHSYSMPDRLARNFAKSLIKDRDFANYLVSLGLNVQIDTNKGQFSLRNPFTNQDGSPLVYGTITQDTFAQALEGAKNFYRKARDGSKHIPDAVKNLLKENTRNTRLDEVAGILSIDPSLSLAKCDRRDGGRI